MSIQPHHLVLRLAAVGKLPETVHDDSVVPVSVVQELVGLGHISAIDVSSLDSPAYRDPAITISGRSLLATLDSEQKASTLASKSGVYLSKTIKWVFGIVATLVAAYLAKQFIG